MNTGGLDYVILFGFVPWYLCCFGVSDCAVLDLGHVTKGALKEIVCGTSAPRPLCVCDTWPLRRYSILICCERRLVRLLVQQHGPLCECQTRRRELHISTAVMAHQTLKKISKDSKKKTD